MMHLRSPILVLCFLLYFTHALVTPPHRQESKLVSMVDDFLTGNPICYRRAWIGSTLAICLGSATAAHAATDCFTDCFKNCKTVAPNNLAYCEEECKDYCDQPDRTDGLSGSVSSTSGEVGILGGTFGTGTVVKGQDKPPTVALPGLDFTNQAGRKLIGY